MPDVRLNNQITSARLIGLNRTNAEENTHFSMYALINKTYDLHLQKIGSYD